MGVDSTNNGIDVAANYIDAGVWSLGCDITLEDMDAEIQEIRVNDIRLSGSVSVKEVSIYINPERSKMMDLDINVVVDGLNPSIVESQVVPYDNILNITSGSLEAIKEKGFAASAYSSKKLYDSIKNIEEKINNIGTGGGGGGSLPPEQVEAIEKLLKWFSFDDERGLIKANYGLYSLGSITAGGRGTSSGSVVTSLSALKDVQLSNPTGGQSLVYDASIGMWVNATISGGSTDVTYSSVVEALGYTPFDASLFTKAKIKSTLGISDWALAASKPSYSWSEIGSKPTTLAGYGITDAMLLAGYESNKSADDILTQGSCGIYEGVTNTPDNSQYGSMLTFGPKGGIFRGQLYIEHSGKFYVRARSSSLVDDSYWRPWREILDNSNYSNYVYGKDQTYSVTQIENRLNNTVIYSDYINITNNDAARHIGYGYAANGWHGSGPAMSFGTALYNLRMQLAIEAADTPRLMVSQVYNGTAYGWAELVTYEGAKGRVFEALRYLIGDSMVLHRSGDDTFVNYGNRSTGDLYLYGKNIRFSHDGGASFPLRVLNDSSVQIHGVNISSGTSGALKAGAYEAQQYFADGKLIMHRNAGAKNFYLNYGGASEPMYLYASTYGFHIGASRERAFTIDSNKDASFVGELSVAGNSYSKNYPGGKAFSQDPTSAFISTIFDADAVSDSSYRMKILRSYLAYDRFNAAYSPVVAFKTGDTHGFISFGYNSANKDKCYIGAGNGDAVNWSGVLFHDNMHLIPKDDGAFLLGYNSNRWSALHAVSVFTDNIYGNVPTGGTYQRYRLVSSGDRMYLQVGAQDGTATAGKLTISGINVSALLDLEIVSQSTLFTGDTQVNGTSQFVSLATFDKGLKIGDATLAWDASAEMLKIDKGFYSTGAITAGGKSSAGQSPSTSVASTEWYNIKTKRITDKSTIATDIYNIIENFNERLLDDQYRIVLMTFKRKTRQGYGWRIPMFSPRYNADTGVIVHEDTPCAIDWNNTWWPVQSSETLTLNQTGMNITDIINIEATGTRFQRSNSKKIRIGFAIFKKTLDAEGNNVGTWGWQRVSNIAEIMLYYAAKKDMTMIRVIE